LMASDESSQKAPKVGVEAFAQHLLAMFAGSGGTGREIHAIALAYDVPEEQIPPCMRLTHASNEDRKNINNDEISFANFEYLVLHFGLFSVTIESITNEIELHSEESKSPALQGRIGPADIDAFLAKCQHAITLCVEPDHPERLAFASREQWMEKSHLKFDQDQNSIPMPEFTKALEGALGNDLELLEALTIVYGVFAESLLWKVQKNKKSAVVVVGDNLTNSPICDAIAARVVEENDRKNPSARISPQKILQVCRDILGAVSTDRVSDSCRRLPLFFTRLSRLSKADVSGTNLLNLAKSLESLLGHDSHQLEQIAEKMGIKYTHSSSSGI